MVRVSARFELARVRVSGVDCITIRRSASSNIVLYSRIFWLKGSDTLIRAETERCDIVRFSKVTTSLWPR